MLGAIRLVNLTAQRNSVEKGTPMFTSSYQLTFLSDASFVGCNSAVT